MIFSRSARERPVSVESIAKDFVENLGEDDREFILSGAHDFGMAGRHIRNHYGLWEPNHPLTQHWHLHPDCREIIDGIDYSEDHPDQVSAEILKLARRFLA